MVEGMKSNILLKVKDDIELSKMFIDSYFDSFRIDDKKVIEVRGNININISDLSYYLNKSEKRIFDKGSIIKILNKIIDCDRNNAILLISLVNQKKYDFESDKDLGEKSMNKLYELKKFVENKR